MDNNSKYIHATMKAAAYALDNAIDSDGLFLHDWKGRSGEKGQLKWLLAEVCMEELFARLALIRKGVHDSYGD